MGAAPGGELFVLIPGAGQRRRLAHGTACGGY